MMTTLIDQDGDGLEQHEVAAAIDETFRAAPATEKQAVMNVVQHNWHSFDPDGSGTISLQEFLKSCLLFMVLAKQNRTSLLKALSF